MAWLEKENIIVAWTGEVTIELEEKVELYQVDKDWVGVVAFQAEKLDL